MRNMQEPRKGEDRCKYYKATYVTNNKLTQDAEPVGIFYSNDYEPVTGSSAVDGLTKAIEWRVTLETEDYILDLLADDYVLYDGNLWRVEKTTAKDKRDNAKMFKNHAYTTLIWLVR